MFIKKVYRISRRKTVDGRVKEFRISDDIVYEFFDIAVVGDVAAALTGDIHLSSGFTVGIDEYHFVIIVCGIQRKKQSRCSGSDTHDLCFVCAVAHINR